MFLVGEGVLRIVVGSKATGELKKSSSLTTGSDLSSTAVGEIVGTFVGLTVGTLVGLVVGTFVGKGLAFLEGCSVGTYLCREQKETKRLEHNN